jgi:hypothetical protein
MRHRDLEKNFSEFLKNEKGYPDTSFIYEVSLHPRNNENFKRYLADLLIIDVEYNNYLALIEFKTTIDKKSFVLAFEQVTTYLKVLNKPELFAYLVVANEQDFDIYLLAKDGWTKIERSDFPHYQTFQSKVEADSKSYLEQVTEDKYKEEKSRKQLITSTAWSAILSLIAGISTVIFFYNDALRNEGLNKQAIMFDSTYINYKKIVWRISSLENQLRKEQYNGSSSDAKRQNSKIKDLENRISNFESSVTSSPDRLLKLQEINFEFKELQNSIVKEREIAELKISNLKERLDQVIIWTSGLIITIFGSIIGFAINAFRKK